MDNHTKPKSHYQANQLTTGEYLGVTLENVNYVKNNLETTNYILCKAHSHKFTLFLYEILDIDSINSKDMEDFIDYLRNNNMLYIRLRLDHKLLFVLFTEKTKDYADGCINSLSNKFSLLAEKPLDTDDTELYEITKNLYEMAIHIPHNLYYKAKRFSGSSLTNEDKRKELIFRKEAFFQKCA